MISLASRQSVIRGTSLKEHALCWMALLLILRKGLSGGKVIVPRHALIQFLSRLQRNVAWCKARRADARQQEYFHRWVRRQLCASTASSRQKTSCVASRHTRRCLMNIQSFAVGLNF